SFDWSALPLRIVVSLIALAIYSAIFRALAPPNDFAFSMGGRALFGLCLIWCTGLLDREKENTHARGFRGVEFRTKVRNQGTTSVVPDRTQTRLWAARTPVSAPTQVNPIAACSSITFKFHH